MTHPQSTEKTMWIRTIRALMLYCVAGFFAVAVAQPTAQTSRAVTPLGDLSSYIKDLELSWDRSEAKMKPLAPEKWTTVDVAIDRALKEVRA